MSETESNEANVPTKKRKPNRVLDEETYLDKMGKIIERDFFPHLKKLVAQNDYLEAVEKNDIAKLRSIYAKYSVGRPPTEGYNSPATFETPLELKKNEDVEISNLTGDKEDGVKSSTTDEEGSIPKSMSLNKYLANYTSEDNQSFEEMMEESEVVKRQKQPWLYKDEKSNAEALGDGLGVPAIEQQLGEGKTRPLDIDTWGYKNKNFIMYVPDGENATSVETSSVSHGNTRFTGCPFDENRSKQTIQGLAQQQVKVLDGKIGVDGKEVVGVDNVGGYNLLRTPSPAPGVSESPFMTWGEIEGTPLRLDATPGPSFRIPEPPRRERLAHALADKHASDRKKRTSTPLMTPKQSVDRLEAMSPAARKLANSQLRKVLGSTDKALLASYSPHINSHTPRTPAIGRSPATPSAVTYIDKPSNITTDNLLKINLPSRPKASDFFS